MSDNEKGRRVKARHDVTQFYQRRCVKRTVSRQDLSIGNFTVEGGSNSSHNTTSSDDEEEETYVPSPRGWGKDIAGGSDSCSRAAEIQEGEEEGEEEEEGVEEIFDVEEITSSSYMHMGTLTSGSLRIWIGRRKSATKEILIWWERIGWKIWGLERRRLELTTCFTLHSSRIFMILSSSPRTSRWQYLIGLIEITRRESMIRYLMRLWLHVKPNTWEISWLLERTGTMRSSHSSSPPCMLRRGETKGNFIGWWRGGGMRSPMSTLLGSLDLGEEIQTAPRFTWHSTLMQASSNSCIQATKEGVRELPLTYFPSMHTWTVFFRKTMTPREGDTFNIPSYNWNILVAMARQPHGFDFCASGFIWEEIKAISESPLKSCGSAPYIMHMIESDSSHLWLWQGASSIKDQEWHKCTRGG
jgi:hypothetical protein